MYRFVNAENANANNHVRFYEDVILIQTDQGLFSMGYGNREVIFLTEHTLITAAFDCFEDQLYFIIAISLDVEGEYREALVSLDLQSKEMREVTQLTDGGMTQTYTEIAVTKDGYYYTNPSASGGLYYHYFDGRDEILISTDK